MQVGMNSVGNALAQAKGVVFILANPFVDNIEFCWNVTSVQSELN